LGWQKKSKVLKAGFKTIGALAETIRSLGQGALFSC
jgi:hypothetical protein